MRSFNFVIKPSYRLLIFIFALHVLSGLVVVWLPVYWLIKLLFIIAILFSLIYYLRRDFLQNTEHSVIAISYQHKTWYVQSNSDSKQRVKIMHATVVTAFFIALCVKNEESKKNAKLMILAADYRPEEYKQLCRALRLTF